jgi:hypothetical protein
MKSIKVQNNLKSKTIIGNPDEMTVQQAFNEAQLEMGNGILNLNGVVVSTQDVNRTLSDIVGVRDTYILASVVKADCA